MTVAFRFGQTLGSMVICMCSERATVKPSSPFFSFWKDENVLELESDELHNSVNPLGEGNGTPLQYSCLENPMDGGAW